MSVLYAWKHLSIHVPFTGGLCSHHACIFTGQKSGKCLKRTHIIPNCALYTSQRDLTAPQTAQRGHSSPLLAVTDSDCSHL